MKIAALLTGKGSSTLKNKNILPILGKPLLAYPAEAAKRSKYIKYFYVSSNDMRILKIAARIGYRNILRPKYLARPDSKHADVIIHALKRINEDGLVPDILVVLLANSVAIRTNWIDTCIKEIMADADLSAIVPVCLDLDRHPFRAKKIAKNGFLKSFFNLGGREISTNRQELEPSYFLCNNFWVLNLKKSVFSKDGEAPWSFMGKNVKPFIMEDCCDVHIKEDLERAARWIRKHRPL